MWIEWQHQHVGIFEQRGCAAAANPKKGRVFLNLMVNETSSTLGDSPVFLGDLDCFGLACAVATTVEVEELGVDVARTSANAISGGHYTCTSRERRQHRAHWRG